jgi:hypothetical protein
MDSVTKAKVKRAIIDSPHLHVKAIIIVIRFQQRMDKKLEIWKQH